MAVLVLVISGCHGGRQPTGAEATDRLRAAAGSCDGNAPVTAPTATQPPAGEANEIVLATDADTSGTQRRRKIIADWNRTHSFQARLVELRESTDLVHADTQAAMQSGYPRYDVMLLDIPWIAEFAAAGYIRPLDGRGFNRSDFFPGPWQAGCYDGHLYAVPFTTDVGLLYCRTDLNIQPPGSWADLAAGVPPRPSTVKFTMATQLDNYEGLTVNAVEAIRNAGGHFMDQEAILDQKARVGLTNMVRAVIAADGAVGSTEYREAGTLEAFKSGTAACMRNWPYARDLIPTKGPNAIQFVAHPLPWQSVLGGWSLVLSASSPHPGQAVELIKFLANHDNEKQIFLADGLPAARPEIYSDPEVLAARPYAADLSRAIGAARPRPTTPHYSEVTGALRKTMSDLLSADEFDQNAVDRQLDQLELRLRGALYGR